RRPRARRGAAGRTGAPCGPAGCRSASPLTLGTPPGSRDVPGPALAEALPAAAGALRVRVVDGEPGALQAVLVVERGALEQHGARRVDDDLDPGELGGLVVVGHVGVEEHLVAEARAATGTHGHAQREVGDALGFHEG